VRVLDVFIEIDPAMAVFNGFRSAHICYTEFCAALLAGALSRLPVVQEVRFEAYPSVPRRGELAGRLVRVAEEAGCHVTWRGDREVGEDEGEEGGVERGDGERDRGGMVPVYARQFEIEA
jgi:hypothetical protein